MGQNDAHIGQEDEGPSRTLDAGKPLYEIGSSIGGYKLLSVLGEGGCGIVYLAEQERPVRRRVALKLIKPGMDTKQVIARFEAERQALALLDHPNIAHVYDAGTTEDGRPYFAMEFVKGVPIVEHCDRQKLTIEQRLQLSWRSVRRFSMLTKRALSTATSSRRTFWF
jgi:serine/threonine protein kinase